MAQGDRTSAFVQEPWIARMIDQPGVVCRPPRSRVRKLDTEDSLFAETLNNPRSIQSYMSFYKEPPFDAEHITEVSTLTIVGDGMNGHPSILHGGIVATLIDEAMGVFQGANGRREHKRAIKLGKEPPVALPTFTAELTVRYLKPVRTPSSIVVSTKRVKKDGRKEWLVSEVRQSVGRKEDSEGEIILCATGQALFIQARPTKI